MQQNQINGNGRKNNSYEMESRSTMGPQVVEAKGNAEREQGDLIGALQSFNRLVHIREYHLTTAPYSSPMNVAHAHRKTADVLNKIVHKLKNANEAVVQKYRTESE